MAVDNTNDERFIERKELRQRYPVNDSTMWRWWTDPEIGFPPPVKLGKNGRDFWWFPDVLVWEQRRRAQQSLAPAVALRRRRRTARG